MCDKRLAQILLQNIYGPDMKIEKAKWWYSQVACISLEFMI